MPTVSVIVPNYNHARFLRQRIDTILAQTFQDFELILLDDGSTDESRSILREYASDPRVRLEFNEVNSGSTFKQWNKGVRLAEGKYIWMAESDDYADLRFLERLVGLLDADPSVAIAYCRSWCVNEDGRLDRFADNYLSNLDPDLWTADFCEGGREMCRKYFSRVNPIANASAVLFRRGAYEQVGGADESLRLCADWKLWAGMAIGGNVAYLCKPLNYFRFHGDSVRNRSVLARIDVAEHIHVCGWVLGRAPVPDAVVEEICRSQAGYWVSALMSFHVPLSTKRTILRNVRALDPHPFRRALRPALTVVRLKVVRHWRHLRSMMTAEKYADR